MVILEIYLANLFDGVIKEDSASPVENMAVKYINWQNNRNIKKEISDMSSSPENMTGTIAGLITPAKGISKVKSLLQQSSESSASWISNTGKEYKLNLHESHQAFIYKLERMFGSKTGTAGTEYDLFVRGWVRKASPGLYSVKQLNNKTINIIRKNIVNSTKIPDKIYIDVKDDKTLTANISDFIKYGKKVLKPYNADDLYKLW
jgi:hypothetical protein